MQKTPQGMKSQKGIRFSHEVAGRTAAAARSFARAPIAKSFDVGWRLSFLFVGRPWQLWRNCEVFSPDVKVRFEGTVDQIVDIQIVRGLSERPSRRIL
jgi:hypothetical protein